MTNPARFRSASPVVLRFLLTAAAAVLTASPATAADDENRWTLRFEPIHMSAYGHDQHVLTVFRSDAGPPQTDTTGAFNLETDAGLAFRGGVHQALGRWGWGIEAFQYFTSQSGPRVSAASDGPGGPVDPVVFVTGNEAYLSNDPSEVLFFTAIEDTDLQVWTADAFGTLALTDRESSRLTLQFGLRIGDFDNDYNALIGIEGVNGSLIKASSNYERMQGIIVGLSADAYRGRNTITGYLAQAVMVGSAELTNFTEEFTGTPDNPTVVALREIRNMQDVAVPITEFRLKWSYRLGKHVALGAGLHTSIWWDVKVPPGVVPGVTDDVLHENTLVFFGLAGSVDVTF